VEGVEQGNSVIHFYQHLILGVPPLPLRVRGRAAPGFASLPWPLEASGHQALRIAHARGYELM
jgi:hypothetical protein